MTLKITQTHRSVFLSIIAAGMVSIFFGYTNDHDACERIQDDRKAVVETLETRSDPILGNKKLNIPPADFTKPPYSRFKEFKVLIVRNAIMDRARAKQYRNRINSEKCGIVRI